MKTRLFFLTCSLVTVLLIVACSPATVTEESAPSANDPAPVTESTVPTSVEATQIPIVQAIVTSRGDKLHATDPSTVSLSSGQLQLIEFFRYT